MVTQSSERMPKPIQKILIFQCAYLFCKICSIPAKMRGFLIPSTHVWGFTFSRNRWANINWLKLTLYCQHCGLTPSTLGNWKWYHYKPKKKFRRNLYMCPALWRIEAIHVLFWTCKKRNTLSKVPGTAGGNSVPIVIAHFSAIWSIWMRDGFSPSPFKRCKIVFFIAILTSFLSTFPNIQYFLLSFFPHPIK